MNTLKKIFVISGRSQAGKDTTADYIKDYYKDLKTIKLQFSSYIKMYAKEISNWDQKENDKPRELLQDLGEQIRMNVDKFFFINRIVEDIKVYQDYFDIVTICDARLPDELDTIKNEFNNVYKIHIIRPNHNPYNTLKEQNHPTEHALDNYQDYDYIIYNDGSLEDLKSKIFNILEEMND